ncbi:unnamed protein product, partial [Prorocentrum cordatum]
VASEGSHLRASGAWATDAANAVCRGACLAQVISRTSADALLIQERGSHSELQLASSARAAYLGAALKSGTHARSIWLFHSQGISESNLHVLAEAAALLGLLSGPWVIAGDWNVAPQMLTDAGWLDVAQGRIASPAISARNGSTCDFFVVSRSLARAALGVSRIDDGGFTPHFPTRCQRRGPGHASAGNQLRGAPLRDAQARPQSPRVAWRTCSARDCETAAVLGLPRPAAHDEVVLARHCSRERAAAQRVAGAPGESPEAFLAWAAAICRARLTRGAFALRAPGARAAQRARRIEGAVAAARPAAHHGAKAAPGGAHTARTSASAPRRLAFRLARGLGGSARSPVGDPHCEEDVPDADPLEFDVFGASRVEVALGGRARATAAPLSEQAALDREARGWAGQRAAGEEHREPCFPARLLSAPQPLATRGLGQAVASFPVGAGLGADRV